ncbi:MAG: anhydro-N-acetylmuramic acid kinase [Candidatus Izimaplasma sp.]|nr:anhydro-N-acetylmuramic acid kinase [Candidatus Izimaplasma bacterium]
MYLRKLAIGIMSGTSLDGIDAVLAEITGSFKQTNIKMLKALTFSYHKSLKHKIKTFLESQTLSLSDICSVNFELAYQYAACVKKLCKESKISLKDIDYIASHGQTLYHINDESQTHISSTLQLGDGSVLANLTNVTVISNFRSADIACDGKGAPLVPYADYVLFSHPKKTRLMQNIGGIANVTVLKQNGRLEDVIAFDNGPGNMMIDYAMTQLFNQPYDNFGQIAKQGNLSEKMLSALMCNPYFDKHPPKSTGRELFGDHVTQNILNQYQHINPEDIITTLTHFTAKTIANSYQTFIDDDIDEVIVSGGGAYNKTLLALIQSYTKIKKVFTLEALDMSSDYKEALAFIILGNETLQHKPSNVPNATGAKKHTILGQISPVYKG